MERKTVNLIEIKFAADPTATEMRFSGYGAVFGNVDSYGDVIEPGAFAKTLSDAQKSGIYPAMLLQHGGFGLTAEDKMPIGVWETLAEDGKGLLVDGILADTTRGLDTYKLMKMKPRPAITGLSIGYIPKKFTIGTKPNQPKRTLHEVDLMEISPVTFPANGKARVSSVKSVEDFTERDFEALMQDAGFSRREARVIINSGFKSLRVMQVADSNELRSLAEALQRNINNLK